MAGAATPKRTRPTCAPGRPVVMLPAVMPAAGTTRWGGDAMRPTIVLSGFFGRGNCGDEAILQAQWEFLSPRFQIVISVDERGAFDGFWDRHPYDRCRIVHQGNLSILAEPDVVAIHVGGGGLPHGFNAAQVVHARSLGKPAFLTGVDSPPCASATAAAAVGRYLELFDLVSVRSLAAWESMSGIAPACTRGTDWAVGLTSGGPGHEPATGDVLVTLREFPADLVTARYVQEVEDLLAVLADSAGRVVLLPLCPEDDRFLDRIPPAARLPRETRWWSPREVQRLIAGAGRMVSVGRFHPLVFAANVATPAMFIEPLAHDPRRPPSSKARQFCAEHGLPYRTSLAGAIDELRRPSGMAWRPATLAPGTAGRRIAMAGELARRLELAARSLSAPAGPGGLARAG